MKYIILLIFFFWGVTMAYGDELKKTEELTQIEIMELKIANDRIKKANKELERVKEKIAFSHSMNKEEYMEWGVYYVIDGNYILFYRKDYQ